MSFNFSTTIDSMTTAHQQVEQTYSSLNQALNNLETEFDNAIPGWVGEASTAYKSLQQRWNADQKQINDALNNLAQALNQAKANYQKAETTNQGNFQS